MRFRTILAGLASAITVSGSTNAVTYVRKLFATAVLALLSVQAPAITLNAGTSPSNGNWAVAFDVAAVNDLHITSFRVRSYLDGTTPFNGLEIWTRSGSYAGNTGTSAGWTRVANLTSAVTPPADVPVSVNIAAGQTQAFVILNTGQSIEIAYENAAPEGALYASDANLKVFIGRGLPNWGSGGNADRQWVGSINYELGVFVAPPSQPTLSPPGSAATPGFDSTSNPLPTVTGTAQPGSIVTVFVDGVAAGTTTADAITGLWTFTATTPLSPGVHQITATATYATETESDASEPLALTITALALVPTLSQWSLLILIAALSWLGLRRTRRIPL